MNPFELFNASTTLRPRSGKRMYAGARVDRLTSDFTGASTSADSETYQSLRVLRNRSRELARDNDYAANAVRIIKNNVVGQGISFQAQVMMRRAVGGKLKLDDDTNSAIEAAWSEWTKKETCSTTGKYSFAELQRMVVAALPLSGEILIRKVRKPFGRGTIPFALEVIESDQLVDNLSLGRAENGNVVKMGVEVDEWGRPAAYWLYPKHPGDFQFAGQPQTNRYLRVPADEVIHLFVKDDRPGMTRGVPAFHTAIRRLNNMGGYEEAEIVAARASACIMGFIESPDDDAAGSDGIVEGERVTALAPAEIKELAPGEKFTGFAPMRPNAAMEPFMRFMLRGMAAGIGVSYESVSRDYSQSNFSSSRLALNDDRDNWKVLQDWLIADLCEAVYREWLEMAVLSGALALPAYWSNPASFQACRWKTRGWSYIDPLKEAMADKLRVRSGFTTIADVIAGQGGDYEDVFRQRQREISFAEECDLVLETDPALVNDKGQGQPDPAAAAALAGDAASSADDAQAKAAAELYVRLDEAMSRNQDALAARILEAIDAIELPAPVIHNHLNAPQPSTKTVISRRRDDGSIESEVTEK